MFDWFGIHEKARTEDRRETTKTDDICRAATAFIKEEENRIYIDKSNF